LEHTTVGLPAMLSDPRIGSMEIRENREVILP